MSVLWLIAREAADDARSLFEHGRFRGAANRIYCAMFSAARALLELRGFDQSRTKTHSTVLSLFLSEFVRTGDFPSQTGQMLRRAENARHVADYGREAVDAADIERLIASMDAFMGIAARHFLDEIDSGVQT